MTDQEYEQAQKRVDTFIIWTIKLVVLCAVGYFIGWLLLGFK